MADFWCETCDLSFRKCCHKDNFRSLTIHSLDVEIELDNGQLAIYNVEYSYTPGSKERRYGHPDNWHEAEAPEVRITKITYEKPLTKEEFGFILNRWEDYFIEQILAQEERP